MFATINDQGEGTYMFKQSQWGKEYQLIGYGFLFLVLSTCGGGTSSTGSGAATGATVTITGTIMEPTTTSANLTSAAVKKGTLRHVEDTAASGTAVEIHTTEGETVATGTTNADGTFSITVPIDTLKGAEDSADTFTEDVIVTSEGGTQNLTTIDYTAGTTTSIDTGTANTDTTAATLQTAAAITDSFDGTWDTDYKTDIDDAGLDLPCLYLTSKAVFENSNADDGGVSTDAKTIISLLAGYLAGSDDHTAAIDIMDGTASANGSLSTIASIAASAEPTIDATTTEADFATFSGSVGAVRDVLKAQFITDGPGATNCDAIKAGTMDPADISGTLLAADDADSLTTSYGSADGGKVFANLLASCISAGEAGCEAKNAPGAFYGFMKATGGTFTDFFDSDGTVSSTVAGISRTFIGGCTGDKTVQKECGKASKATIAASSGGFSDFSDTTGAAATAVYLREHFKSSGDTADNFNYGTFITGGTLDSVKGAGTTAVDCVAAGSTNCFGSAPAPTGSTFTCSTSNCGSTFTTGSTSGGTISGLENGKACTSNSQCTSTNCSSGICATASSGSGSTSLKANGLSCTASNQCTSGNCASGICAAVSSVSLTGFAGAFKAGNICTNHSMDASNYDVTLTGTNPYEIKAMGTTMTTVNLSASSCTGSIPSGASCSSCSYTGTGSAGSVITTNCPVSGGTCAYTFTKQ